MIAFNKQNTIEAKVQFVLANKRTSGKIRKNSNQMHPSDQKVFEDIINKIEEKDEKKYGKENSPCKAEQFQSVYSSPKIIKPRGRICKNKINERESVLLQNQASQQLKLSEMEKSPSSLKTAEQIIEEFRNLKKVAEKKEHHNVAVLVRRGKGRQQFIKRLQKQIQFQRELRNLKHQVSQKDKEALITILSEQYKIGQEALTLHAEEFDPFFIGKKIENLQVFACQFYIANSRANSHWNDEVLNKFEEECLSQIFDELNGNSKEEVLSLKAFAKQLGIVLGNFNCTKIRDVNGLYHRLRPFKKENFISLLKCNRPQNFKKND